MDGFIPHAELGCPGYEELHPGEKYSYSHCSTAWHREWMTPDGKLAVGLNEDGTVDEILHDGDVHCHLEMMSDQCIWMCLAHRYVFHFTYEKGRRICLSYSYDEGES